MAIRQSGIESQIQTLFDGGTVTGLTDEELLEQFANRRGGGAELAFAALVAKHGPMVLSVCRGLLRNPHDAEDAFQATFLVLALKAGSLRKPNLVGPWLHGVAHHTARRLRDRNARRKHREAEAAMSGMRTAENAGGQQPRSASHDEIEALHEEIERLPERYRVAIVLCDLQGLTHQAAAQRLGRPVGTVSARLSRARERLKGQLSRRGLALPAGVVTAAIATSHASAMPATLVESTIKVAMTGSEGLTAGAVPASIASLSKGVLKSMFLTKLKMMSATVLLAGATAGSVAVVAQQSLSPRRAPQVDVGIPKGSESSPLQTAKTQSDGEGPLGKIMEKVNKSNAIIQKGTRNPVNFKKSQKDVAKHAKELVKLGKEAKKIRSAVKTAKDVTDPDKKWDELMEDFIKTSGKLGEVAGKTNAVFQNAKDAFGVVKKSCADCHVVFKVEDNDF
jgi:RNA polymerase sigma factor (sigma-70 family)